MRGIWSLDMAKTLTVNLRAIRRQIGKEIATLEKAIRLGAEVVSDGAVQSRSFAGGQREKQALARKLQKNKDTLSKAKKMLKTMERQEIAFADECCNQQIQNCN